MNEVMRLNFQPLLNRYNSVDNFSPDSLRRRFILPEHVTAIPEYFSAGHGPGTVVYLRSVGWAPSCPFSHHRHGRRPLAREDVRLADEVALHGAKAGRLVLAQLAVECPLRGRRRE